MHKPPFSTMSLYKKSSFVALLVLNIFASVSTDGVNRTVSDAAVAAAVVPSSVFTAGADSSFSLNLLSSFAEDPEISDYCRDLLNIFRQRCVAHVNCLVPAARPVKICQNCFSTNASLNEIYTNISDKMGPGNASCRDSLLRSDRLMVVYLLYSNLKDLWSKANCDNCIANGFQSLTNDTLYYMTNLNQTLTCFEKYPQQGNYTELCKNCKNGYKELNELYSGMEKNATLCIDIEDAMNLTRRLWSNFTCSIPREETVPVIAVSSFMLFLPIIFYLSSFLHSEQKKRKLIHPKRAKSYTSLVNIQDKLN